MGSSASIAQVSAEDVGAFVGNLGGGVHVYKDKFLEYEIDGHMLATMDDKMLEENLEELGITSKLHRKKLTSELLKIKTLTTHKSIPELPIATAADIKAASQQAEEFPDRVTVPPSVLMSRLFMIQGISCDPSDVDSCVVKLAATIKAVIAKSIEHGIPSKEFSCHKLSRFR